MPPLAYQNLRDRALHVVFASDITPQEKTVWSSALGQASPPMLFTFLEVCENDREGLHQATELLLLKIEMKAGGKSSEEVLGRERAILDDTPTKEGTV